MHQRWMNRQKIHVLNEKVLCTKNTRFSPRVKWGKPRLLRRYSPEQAELRMRMDPREGGGLPDSDPGGSRLANFTALPSAGRAIEMLGCRAMPPKPRD